MSHIKRFISEYQLAVITEFLRTQSSKTGIIHFSFQYNKTTGGSVIYCYRRCQLANGARARLIFHIKNNIDWEKFRYVSCMIYNTNISKSSQAKKPSQLLRLPQDNVKYKIAPKNKVMNKCSFENSISKQGKRK